MRDNQFTMGFDAQVGYNLFLDGLGVPPISETFTLAYVHLQPQQW